MQNSHLAVSTCSTAARGRSRQRGQFTSFWLATWLLANSLPRSAKAQTAQEVFLQWAAAPDTHSNLPNVSFAGYGRGERTPPQLPSTIRVTELGALGDGLSDDTAAFEMALSMAAESCGVIEVAAGTYRLTRPLFFDTSGVVMVGAGSGSTILDFQVSLTEALGALPLDTSSQWSWAGGLIWIGPKDTFSGGSLVTEGFSKIQGWEYWRPLAPFTPVVAAAPRGSSVITVADASSFSVGELVLLTWTNTEDHSLLKMVYGHAASADAYDWESATWLSPDEYPRFQWPVLITAISGNSLTLAQPLRLDAGPEWEVQVHPIGSHVREVGLEGVQLRLHAPQTHNHLMNVGYNGVYFNRAYNSWLRDVVVRDAENPVLLAATKNVSVIDLKVTGEAQNHHSIACRVNSHDNLFEDFLVDGPGRVKHGINVEWLSSGNVWSRGTQRMGTLDTHRGLAFDNVRTELSIRDEVDAAPGGAGQAGPFIGARMVHWNLENLNTDPPHEDPGRFIHHSNQYVLGALVGVRGPESSAAALALPAGDKGTILVENQSVPSIKNLYRAQLSHRLGDAPPITSRSSCGNLLRELPSEQTGAGSGGGPGSDSPVPTGGNPASAPSDPPGAASKAPSEPRSSGACSCRMGPHRRIGQNIAPFLLVTLGYLRRCLRRNRLKWRAAPKMPPTP